jgi:hypothetical protein
VTVVQTVALPILFAYFYAVIWVFAAAALM